MDGFVLMEIGDGTIHADAIFAANIINPKMTKIFQFITTPHL